MPVADLESMVEDLVKMDITFSDSYNEFQESTLIEKKQSYDKFRNGLNECWEALAEIIGTWKVENIKNKVK